MLTTYRLKGGDKIVATSPAAFLHQLRTGSRFDSEGTDEEYMCVSLTAYRNSRATLFPQTAPMPSLPI